MAKRDNGEGSIRQRPDGTYEGRLRIGDGKRRSVYGKTKREVRDQLTTARRNLEAGRLPADPSKTVGTYLDEWLEYRVRPALRPSSYDNYCLNVQRVKPVIGSLRLTDLRDTHIQACYQALREGGAGATRPLAEKTVEQAHRTLKIALRDAVKRRAIPYNPMELVTPPKAAAKEMAALAPEEAEALLQQTEAHRLHALFVVLITCGLRIGEATALAWGDVDLDRGTVTVRRSIHHEKGKGKVLGPTKTAGSSRTVDLPGRAVTALRRHKAAQAAERLKACIWHDTALIFPNTTGKPLDAKTVWNALQRALASAGLPAIRTHDLRHTFATIALQVGVSIKGVQNALGHQSAMLTLDTYAHVTRDMRKEVATAMDAVFPEAKQTS